MNKPIIGKAKPINGMSASEFISFTSNPTAFGRMKITISIALIIQNDNTQIQFIFFVIIPAMIRPTAKEIAKILAIMMLIFSGR